LHLFDDAAEDAAPASAADRADARLDKEHRNSASGGVLVLPPSFASADGTYDLVLHFHGNTDLVEESFAVSKLNAAVLIQNLGIGSGPYEDKYTNPASFRDTLERVDEAMARRGLREPRRRRVAITAWSAGYGAAARILENAANADMVDTVL